ncbi:LOW QUALITY PROTEIN: lipase member K-like [Theristicus caerulescens]
MGLTPTGAVGFSSAFIAFSTMPQLTQKIKMYFALAPVATVIFVQSPLKKLAFFSDYGLKSRVDVYTAHSPGGTSANVIHWLQGVQSGALKAYDGGSTCNSLCYRQMGPPLYNLKDMKVPTTIWSGRVDCLADPQDIAILLPQVRNLVHNKVIPQWNHLDFLLGLDATEVLYQEIIDMTKRHP